MRDPLPRLRRLCLAQPNAYEREAWGSPTFRVDGGKMFAMYSADTARGDRGRPQVWVNCSKTDQEFLVAASRTRYFVPPYVGPSGWVGVWLDGAVDWKGLAALLADGWRRAAPKTLLKRLEKAPAAPAATTTRRKRPPGSRA